MRKFTIYMDYGLCAASWETPLVDEKTTGPTQLRKIFGIGLDTLTSLTVLIKE